MPKKSFAIILAVIVALMPFLGFPIAWENVFYTIAGVLIVILSLDWKISKKKSRRPSSRRPKQPSGNEVYIESVPKVPPQVEAKGDM